MQYAFSGKEFDVTIMIHSVLWKFFFKSKIYVFSKSFSDMTGEELGICFNSYKPEYLKLYWECAMHQFTE